ncbi:GNAT family N-acetyltransferase [Paenarthrobacter sp. AMU7]|uniref:GNAT family N-acetyltransferase n=1 Tax=Paenarthrobacter sp. AMU7 TaxID=3162492 RepID=A0AB39YPT2_9MICC
MRAIAFRDGTPSDPEMKRKALAKLTIPGSILSIAECRSGTNGFTLALDETPTGAARTAHLALLAVDPASQSGGLGRALLANITQSLSAEGFTEVSLRVLNENSSARELYEKAGWKITGRGIFEDSGRPYVRYLLGLTENDS